ncbi:hypothetical protein C8J57DRAFT_260128 [Mycena rebaudengoi]|nr:hypothetical protein C8J57DRAFT_260128 [Mycena rebaudengoi]
MFFLSAFAVSLLCELSLCIPLPDNATSLLPPVPTATLQSVAQTPPLSTADTLLFAPAQIIPIPPPARIAAAEENDTLNLFPPDRPPLAPSSLPSESLATTVIEILTDTKTVTEAPTTITVSAAPTTVTDVVTVIVSAPPPPPLSLATPGPKAAWTAPAHMTDMSAFNISAFPGGQQNLRLVKGIPASASATSFADAAVETPDAASDTGWNNASTVMQLLYPANSINPGTKPQGGAEFYAAPLALASAKSVNLTYSVFFPDGFDWVKAGKLPGLYGGHTGCSGGAAAGDCFSTRMMWRRDGIGELYLYAPKDKQTNALCSDSKSVCDSAYGMSVGRGSFSYAAGAWTTVLQTVQLNTPGKQNGVFTLHVNGKQVLHRADVFYRDVAASPAKPTKTKTSTKAPPTSTADDDDGDDGGDLPVVGPLLSGLLGRRRAVVQEVPRDMRPLMLPPQTASPQSPLPVSPPLAPQGGPATVTMTLPATTTMTSTVWLTSIMYPTMLPISDQTTQRGPVGFDGIFFSTFFGGHQADYATPRDQYVWFKDFALTVNS